ncbi:aminotransferase class V-fold PLP-dependent enzyme [bacterium]|nr:aminotransferase class V-fold PLP-dependent enzyme [bacterium]
MSSSRRDFLRNLSLGLGSLGLMGVTAKKAHSAFEEKLKEIKKLTPYQAARDESFWFQVQKAFDIDRSFINLNNGGVHPAPRVVMKAVHRYLNFSNGAPPYNMWRILRPRKEYIRKRLASTFGCSPEEIALTRNVTEAMQIALLGLELHKGDEVLTTSHDYPSMKNALYQRQKREGIRVKKFDFPYPPQNRKVLLDFFKKNITSRTKLILVCHITNLTGQIFPIKELCRLAREKGIEVVIDGAHAFGHFEFKQKDLNCGIYGANLHKWMMAPIGTGFLYVRKDKIKKIWPLFPAPNPLGEDIRKFEHIGTHPEYLECAIGEALTFHHGIGAARKEERLRYLRNYWAQSIGKLPGVKILTPYDPAQSCGIGTFTVKNMDMAQLCHVLFKKHKIYTINVGIPPTAGKNERVTGMRVTPSVYTTLKELDEFNEAVSHYIHKGLPS